MLYVPLFNGKLYWDCAAEFLTDADLLMCHVHPEAAYNLGLRFAKIPLV